MDFLTDKVRYFNRTLFFSVFVIASMEAFTRHFGEYNDSTGSYELDSQWLSLFNSLNYIGFAAATITVTSNTNEQIMAGRILNYVYVGMELEVVPIFQAEIVPAPVRGFVVGSYQLSLTLGGVVINAVCYGTSHIGDNRAWRRSLGLFYIVPTIIAASVFFLPESPRFVELFQRRNLKRTLIVVLVNFFQATGQAFTSQYGGVYVRPLKIFNPQLFTLMSSCISASVMVCMLLISVKVGRRKLLMVPSVIMMSGLLVMGGLGVDEPVTTPRMKGVIALMVIFGVGFATGWGPLTYVVVTEVTSLRLRDYTSRVGFATNVCFNFAVNFSVPYLVFPDEVGLGSKVGFIFGAVAFLSLVFTFFCVPECKGKTLEQVDWFFNNGVRLRDFGKTDASGMLNEEMGGGKAVNDIEAPSETITSSHVVKA
ncbi:major facilitator superfamily domain-containing protein [Aspergillus crustosus]